MFEFEFKEEHDDYYRGYVAGLYNVGYDTGLAMFNVQEMNDYLNGHIDGVADWNTEYSSFEFQPGVALPKQHTTGGWSCIVDLMRDGDSITRVMGNGGSYHTEWALDPLFVLKVSNPNDGNPGRATRTKTDEFESWVYTQLEPRLVIDNPPED